MKNEKQNERGKKLTKEEKNVKKQENKNLKEIERQKRKSEKDKQKSKQKSQKQEKLVLKKEQKQKKKEERLVKIKAKRDAKYKKLRHDINSKQSKKECEEKQETWYKLDNSALVYPAICNNEWNSVFRISAVMKEDVNPTILQNALDLTVKRFPFFNVALREGIFWNYFQMLTTRPLVQLETDYPCRPFVFKKNAPIFRVLYYHNKISFEMFHSLSDGLGATQFLNTLIVTYLELTGVEIQDKDQYGYNVYDKPNEEEREDSFKRYADLKHLRSRKERKAYAVNQEIEPIDVLKVFSGTISVSKLKELAKSYNATINELIASVYLKVIIAHKKRYNRSNKRPVKLSIPVNIRKHLPSKTLRNFSLVLNVEVPRDKEDGDIPELIQIVKDEMKRLTQDYVIGFISKNVNSEKNFFVRLIPLFIKKPIISAFYSQIGEVLFTSTLTNIGKLPLPKAVEDNLLEYQAILGATKLNRFNLAVSSFGDTLTATITSRLKDNSIPKEFFSTLSKMGVEISLKSNV